MRGQQVAKQLCSPGRVHGSIDQLAVRRDRTSPGRRFAIGCGLEVLLQNGRSMRVVTLHVGSPLFLVKPDVLPELARNTASATYMIAEAANRKFSTFGMGVIQALKKRIHEF